jgi:Transposase, Mutator family
VPAGHHWRHAGGQKGARRPHRRRAREHAILEGVAPRSQEAWACDRPQLTVADGALGFWQAVEEVWPKTRGQRCWVHKTANILNKLPKSLQSKAKRALPGAQRITLGADKGYDAAAFVADLRALNVTPHIAQNTSGRRSAIDARTTRHPGYAVSQQKRKRIEEPFGWAKTIGGFARPMLRAPKSSVSSSP